MKHILDRPVWSALTSRHAALTEGNDLARRYPASIVPFAASRDNGEESVQALDGLVAEGESIYMLQADEIVLPFGLAAVVTAPGVQMIAEQPLRRIDDERIRPLCDADAADMLELATLTKPGPFTLRALSLGRFWGIRIDGRLAAMAGERMKQDGFTELSGVCTHPDFQGRGLGRLMSRFAAGEIAASGNVAYLHAYASNTAATSLYASLGFRQRSEMNVAVVQRKVL